MVRNSLGVVLAATALVGCGDDGGRTTVSGGQTDGTTTPVTATGTAGPTTGDTASVPTTGDVGTVSESNSQGETTTPTPTTTDASATGTSTTTPDPTTGEPQTDTGNTTEPVDPCAGEMGAFDFSYLWVANTSQGSVSKIDTLHAANCGVYGRIQAVG